MTTKPLSSSKTEHFRRALMLGNAAIDALLNEHPEDWKERIRLAIPDEFEEATVDDYLISHKIASDSTI